MTFAPRRLAALAVLIALLASLATAGVAMAAVGAVTQADCDQGTITDQSTGAPISASSATRPRRTVAGR